MNNEHEMWSQCIQTDMHFESGSTQVGSTVTDNEGMSLGSKDDRLLVPSGYTYRSCTVTPVHWPRRRTVQTNCAPPFQNLYRSVVSNSIFVFIVCLTLCLVQPIGAIRQSRCYSCTSQFIGSSWEVFEWNKIFAQPESFTDDCEKPDKPGSIVRTRQCDGNWNCVSLLMYFPMGRGGRGHVRGCFESIFRGGFNMSGAGGAMRYQDFCGTYNLTTLRKNTGDQYHDQVVRACSCRGELCNGAYTNTNMALSQHWTLLTLYAIALAHTLLYFTCTT